MLNLRRNGEGVMLTAGFFFLGRHSKSGDPCSLEVHLRWCGPFDGVKVHNKQL